MSIIEKEILKRKQLIESVAEKEKELEDLIAREEELKKDLESIDVVELNAEILELETYLPKVEEPIVEIEEQPTIIATPII